MTKDERLYLVGAGATHVGHVRKTNQDTFIVSSELELYAVMDGMGGHWGGELAARSRATICLSTSSAVPVRRRTLAN
jgi:serine/threonine protein phosphatase PrpC